MDTDVINPVAEPIELDHPKLQDLIDRLNPGFQAIQVASHDELSLPYSWCYWNAHKTALEKGGTIVFGWMLYQWPNQFLAAEHHAVWATQDGHLYDVTSRGPNSSITETLFVEDPRQSYPLDRPPNVRTERIDISMSRQVHEFNASYKAKHRCTEELICYLYKNGFRWSPVTQNPSRSTAPTAHEAKRVDELNEKIRKAEVRLGTAITELKNC